MRVGNSITARLAETFPISGLDEGLPELTRSLDDGVEKLLTGTLLEDDKRLNPLYVESLLNDCISRINSCISLRDKAQEVETRAIAEALSYQAQKASADFQKVFRENIGTDYRLLLQNAIGATFADNKITPVTFSEEIWAILDKAQAEMVAVYDQTLETRALKARQPGNGANFSERFATIKALFDLAIVEAYRRCRVAKTGLDKIYGLNSVDLPEPSPSGYLDKLALWAQTVSDLLDAELDERKVATALFVLGAAGADTDEICLMTRENFNVQLDARSLAFELNPDHFEALEMKDVKLRSVKLQARLPNDDLKTHLWRSRLTLPPNPVTAIADTHPLLMATSFQDLFDSDIVVKGVHNVSPLGAWRVEIDKTSPTGNPVNRANINNIWLLLRVSYKSA